LPSNRSSSELLFSKTSQWKTRSKAWKPCSLPPLEEEDSSSEDDEFDDHMLPSDESQNSDLRKPPE